VERGGGGGKLHPRENILLYKSLSKHQKRKMMVPLDKPNLQKYKTNPLKIL
jgi:hypothetical protein